MPSPSAVLRKFVTDGLRETIDYYSAGDLPMHRFAWELQVRLDTLCDLPELCDKTDHRALSRLRSLQQAVGTLDAILRADGRSELTTDEHNALTATLVGLRGSLGQLTDGMADEMADRGETGGHGRQKPIPAPRHSA